MAECALTPELVGWLTPKELVNKAHTALGKADEALRNSEDPEPYLEELALLAGHKDYKESVRITPEKIAFLKKDRLAWLIAHAEIKTSTGQTFPDWSDDVREALSREYPLQRIEQLEQKNRVNQAQNLMNQAGQHIGADDRVPKFFQLFEAFEHAGGIDKVKIDHNKLIAWVRSIANQQIELAETETESGWKPFGHLEVLSRVLKLVGNLRDPSYQLDWKHLERIEDFCATKGAQDFCTETINRLFPEIVLRRPFILLDRPLIHQHQPH